MYDIFLKDISHLKLYHSFRQHPFPVPYNLENSLLVSMAGSSGTWATLHSNSFLQGLIQDSGSSKQSLHFDRVVLLLHTNTYLIQLCCLFVKPLLYLQAQHCSQTSIYKSHLLHCQKGNYFFPTTINTIY